MKAVAIITILLFLGNATSNAAVYEVSGFSDKVKSAENTQKKSQWCWAASIQAVLASAGINRSQDEIVMQTYGTLVDLPMADPQMLYGVLNTNRPDGVGIKDCISSRYFSGSPSATFMKEEISNDRPVILWYSNPMGGGGHSIVAFRIEYEEAGGMPVVNSVDYFDPWPGKGIQHVTRMQLAPLVVTYFSIHAKRTTSEEEIAAKESGHGSQLERRERVREIAHFLIDGKPDEIRKDFSLQLSQMLSVQQMQATIAQVAAVRGRFKTNGEPMISQQGNLTAYDVICGCEMGNVAIRIVYNSDEKIDAIWIFAV